MRCLAYGFASGPGECLHLRKPFYGSASALPEGCLQVVSELSNYLLFVTEEEITNPDGYENPTQ